CTDGADSRDRHHREALHREPGRRPVARPARVASPRLALYGERACDQAVPLCVAREEEPRSSARGPRARPPARLMRVSRRRFLGGAAAAAIGGAGIYELVDQLTKSPSRPAVEPTGMPREQHVFDLRTVTSEGVEVLVPPLHHEVITGTIKTTD